MRCFTVTEHKSIGLHLIVDEGVVGIQIGQKGEVHKIPLSSHFQDLMESLPPGGEELMKRFSIEWAKWDEGGDPRAPSDELDKDDERISTQVLVHIATPPEDGLHFTSSAFSERLVDGEVIQIHEQFPPIGVEVLAIGGEENHMLLRMKKRSSFRLLRPGAPAEKWNWSKIIWTGRDLLIHPHFRRGRRQPRAA